MIKSGDRIEIEESAARGEKLHDVSAQVSEDTSGFHLRFAPPGEFSKSSARNWLTWQAGYLIVERRRHPVNGAMPNGFDQVVTVFHLLGYGENRKDAINMANRRQRGFV